MESSNKWYEKVPVQKEGENAMSEAMLALLGFATIIIVIALLLRNVTVPALAFVSVSTVTGADPCSNRNIYGLKKWGNL